MIVFLDVPFSVKAANISKLRSKYVRHYMGCKKVSPLFGISSVVKQIWIPAWVGAEKTTPPWCQPRASPTQPTGRSRKSRVKPTGFPTWWLHSLLWASWVVEFHHFSRSLWGITKSKHLPTKPKKENTKKITINKLPGFFFLVTIHPKGFVELRSKTALSLSWSCRTCRWGRWDDDWHGNFWTLWSLIQPKHKSKILFPLLGSYPCSFSNVSKFFKDYLSSISQIS